MVYDIIMNLGWVSVTGKSLGEVEISTLEGIFANNMRAALRRRAMYIHLQTVQDNQTKHRNSQKTEISQKNTWYL